MPRTSPEIKTLIELSIEAMKVKHPSMPVHAIPKPKYSEKTSNGLTKCIIDYIKLLGYHAERISNTGRYLQGKSYKNVFGKEVQLTKGKYIKGSGRNDTADISAVVNGIPMAIEVKIGKDKMSEAQEQYKKDFENAGGIYIIAKCFKDVFVEVNKILDD